MALPDHSLPATNLLADYISPYDRYTDDLTDFEAGGVALNDGTQGLDNQIWSLRYDGEEESATYGDLIVTGETSGETSAVINVPGVKSCALAFDQNMNPFIAYELETGEAKFYWYDTVSQAYTTTTLPSGSRSVQCCLDDHRQTQTTTSDIILAYIRSGSLYYREQRDRYGVEYELASNVGASELYKVGMTLNWRLKFDIRKGRGVRLSEIVGDILTMGADSNVGWIKGGPGAMNPTDFDVSALYPTIVRGFKTAGGYSKQDAIRKLQELYLFDFPEVDGRLQAVVRGAPPMATILQSDLVITSETDLENAREQGVEFPRKVNLQWECAEADYATIHETSERRSPDVRVMSELNIETAVNLEADEAAQRAEIIHTVMWNHMEGKIKASLPEQWAFLVPSDPILFEVRPGVLKRMIITRYEFANGQFDMEAVIDRVSSYGSDAVAANRLPPSETPVWNPGLTEWEYMDLPILDGVSDEVMFRVAGHGAADTTWPGAKLQRLIGTEYETEAQFTYPEIMGELTAALPAAPVDFIDTTNTVLASFSGVPESITTAQILQGKGMWLIGDEIVQVRDWIRVSAGVYRGFYMTRGRKDTTPASHAIGTRIVRLDAPDRIPLDSTMIGQTLTLKAVTLGTDEDAVTGADYSFTGRSVKEWAPHELVATKSGSDWELSWTPRYRLGSSADPQPSAYFYGWVVRFTVGATTVTKTINSITPEYTYTAADQTTDFGSAQSSFDTVEIRALHQLGGEGDALSEAVS